MKTKTLFVGLIPFALAASATLASAEVKQPQEIIDRPRTTPGGQITVGGDISFPLNPGAFDTVGLNVLGLYGVNDKLEVGANYALALKEFEAKGDVGVNAAYSLLKDDKLTLAADVRVGYNLLVEILDPISVGAEVQFKINDKIAVYSPGGQLHIGVQSKDETVGGVTVSVKTPTGLSLPVGVGFQATPQIFAHVDTNIADIGIDPSGSAFIFADILPLNVGAYFSPSNTMDFGANLTWGNLKDASDAIGASVSARLHM